MPTASAETTARHAREAHPAVEAWTAEKQGRLAAPRDAAAAGAVAPRAAGAREVPAKGASEVSDWGAMDA